MKNKKIYSVLLIFAMLFVMFPMSAYANSGISVVIDGDKLAFDVEPQLINDRTMVPMRKIFESMGASVEWDGTSYTVTAKKDGISVVMQINNNVINVNGVDVTLDVPPMIVNDRTLVPVRAVAESFDATVEWDGGSKTVVITTEIDLSNVLMYMHPGYGSSLVINNPEWIFYTNDNETHFRNRVKFAANDYIALSAASLSDNFEQAVQSKVNNIKATLESTYAVSDVKFNEKNSKRVGNLNGYSYSFEYTKEGSAVVGNAVFWVCNNIMYTCVSHADAKAPGEVQGVMNVMLKSFKGM